MNHVPNFSSLPPLRDVIRDHGLAARKDLGQHFLLDSNLTDRIARAARASGARNLSGASIIEVGPGPGGLTRSLLRLGATVLAVEIDSRAALALQALSNIANGRLALVQADALSVRIQQLAKENGLAPPYRIVSNLPYNVGTPLLVRWLHDLDEIDTMVLMLQKEVVDRLVAATGSKAYGRLTVITQWLCATERLFNVPATAFTPPPKVISSVVSLKPRTALLASAPLEVLERVTAAAFGQRRKMLRQSLKSLFPDPDTILAGLDIDPTRRAETLSIEEFCAIARTTASGET